MSKKVNGLHADGIMRDVMFLTTECVSHHILGGAPHIECIFMARSEESKPFGERNVLSFRVSWERNEYMVTFMGAKGVRYQALGRIDRPQDLKIPLWVIEAYLEGEFVDTSNLSSLERLRFSRVVAALLELRDEGEIRLAHAIEQLRLLSQNQAA